MQITLQQVQFKNDFLEVVKIAGSGAVAKFNHQYWVSVKRVCENLGLQYETQFKKIKSDAESFEPQLIEVKTNGGVQKVFCIPLSKLNGWLFSINPNRVKPEVREKLIAYKKECFDVLFNHFIKKAQKQINPNLLGEYDEKLITELIKRSDIVRGYQGQIKALENELAEKQSKIKNLELEIKNLKHQNAQIISQIPKIFSQEISVLEKMFDTYYQAMKIEIEHNLKHIKETDEYYQIGLTKIPKIRG